MTSECVAKKVWLMKLLHMPDEEMLKQRDASLSLSAVSDFTPHFHSLRVGLKRKLLIGVTAELNKSVLQQAQVVVEHRTISRAVAMISWTYYWEVAKSFCGTACKHTNQNKY